MAANDYCSWAEVEATLVGPTWGSTYDTIGALLITRCSRAIDTYADVEPGFFYVSADTTRWFDGTGSAHLWVGRLAAAPTTVSMALTGVVDNAAGSGGSYTALTTSDYLLWPSNSLLEGEPYERLDIAGSTYTAWEQGYKTVKIVGKYGWATAVPDEIKQATIIEVTKILNRGLQAYQDTGAVVDLAQMTYTQPLDPATVAYLAPIMKKLKAKMGSQ